MRKTTLRHWLAGGAAAGALSIAFAAQAQDATYAFNQPSLPLAEALQAVGHQTGANILIDSRLAGGLRSPPLKGELTTDAALMALLDGTGLVAERTAKNSILIRKVTADPQGASADGAGTVEALIVTAQKREEDIQDVPIAISAFSQEDLTRSQVAGGPDLMTQVPNMTFTKTNFSSYSIQIRGIGTQAISATTDPAVAVAFNNTPFVRNRFFEQEFYDLQRVEVLRGPQGTLYGRNATAGVVNIISAKPSFRYEARASADISNYSSARLEGMINLPLVEDHVALRLAGAWTKRDGYVTNEITGNPIDGRDLWSTRVSLRVTPNDRFDANLIWEHFEENDDRLRSGKQLCHQDDRAEINGIPVFAVNPLGLGATQWFSQGCLPASLYSPDSFEAPNGYSVPYFLPLQGLGLQIAILDPYLNKTQSRDLRVIESTVDPEYRATSDIVEFQASFDITDSLTLSSETAYNYDELFSKQDLNRFNTRSGVFRAPDDYPANVQAGLRPGVTSPGPNGGIFCDPQIGCADRLVALDLSTARSRQFSQELRLASDFDGPFNFSLGANFMRYDTEDKYYVFINTLGLFTADPGGPGNVGGSYTNTPYVVGESDGHECLGRPYFPDPLVPQDVVGCSYMDPNPIGSLNDEGHNYFLSKNPYKLISYAAFGEVYYQVTDNLKVTGGLRWTVDRKEAPRIPSWVLATGTVGYPIAAVEEQEWREPTGRFTIDWKPELPFTDETMVYFSYAHGYKAGGSNPPPSGKVCYTCGGAGGDATQFVINESLTKPKTFDAEFIDAFEIGAKNTLFDGRVTLNLAAFYYDYKDYQISQIIDRSAVNYNFDTEVWGLEVEADWRPLENLRFGLKLGYQNTKVGDGEKAIDIMERNYGHGEGSDDPWVVMRPFPTFTENCVLPLYTVHWGGFVAPPPGQLINGVMGPCEFAYGLGVDPVTQDPYQPLLGSYPGFNPFDESQGHNFGEGFYKDLSGNELPNAPHYTATLTADYTLPLPKDWLMTLHSDLYYQAEAWTRIFNMEGYDKLKAYTNINLAAIFTNEEQGWKVMAYVKNVMDRDSITGAFLFSDDVGLTTNVFLTEPRLYGVRVTKEWSGGPWWTGANPDHPAGEPYPLTLELGGAIQRIEAPYDPVESGGDFQGILDPARGQNRDLDANETKEFRLTYQPAGSLWNLSAGVRFGRAKGLDKFWDEDPLDEAVCGYDPAGPLGFVCTLLPDIAVISGERLPANWSKGTVTNHEEHTLVDFTVGREVGLGGLASTISGGVQYARLESASRLDMAGVPDWTLVEGWGFLPTTRHRYDTDLTAHREFEGSGPKLAIEIAQPLWGDDATGRSSLEASLNGGVLFGKQTFRVEGEERSSYYILTGSYINQYPDIGGGPGSGGRIDRAPASTALLAKPQARSRSVTAPVLGASLGLSYEMRRFKVGAGYRWERYFDAIDGGFLSEQSYDRTIDGPYFKLSVGFGG